MSIVRPMQLVHNDTSGVLSHLFWNELAVFPAIWILALFFPLRFPCFSKTDCLQWWETSYWPMIFLSLRLLRCLNYRRFAFQRLSIEPLTVFRILICRDWLAHLTWHKFVIELPYLDPLSPIWDTNWLNCAPSVIDWPRRVHWYFVSWHLIFEFSEFATLSLIFNFWTIWFQVIWVYLVVKRW